MWAVKIRKVVRNLNGKLLRFSAALMIVAAFALSCTRKDATTTKQLASLGLIGIQSSNITYATSVPLLNSDYSNKAYFILLSYTKTEFDRFVTANNFKKENVLFVPKKENPPPKTPNWWNVPKTNEDLYSKKIDKIFVFVFWTEEKAYLYFHD
jgi:hypothetical protein